MLMPKSTKFRKQHRGRRRGLAYRGSKINFGDFALQAVTRGWITSRQIEAARIAITHHVKRGGRVWIRVFPDKPTTKKPLETRIVTYVCIFCLAQPTAVGCHLLRCR